MAASLSKLDPKVWASYLAVGRKVLEDDPNPPKSRIIEAIKKEMGVGPGYKTVAKILAELKGKPVPAAAPAQAPRQRVVPMQKSEEVKLAEAIREVHVAMRRTNVTQVHITAGGGVRLTHAEEYNL